LRLLSFPGAIPVFGRLGFPGDTLRRHQELFKAFGTLSDEEWLSRNTDGPDNPYSRVYSRTEVEKLMVGKFRIVHNLAHYFDFRHWGPLGRVLPKRAIQVLGCLWGWHRLVLAERT